jgi:type I restriction-modification system DNA methylase subunit
VCKPDTEQAGVNKPVARIFKWPRANPKKQGWGIGATLASKRKYGLPPAWIQHFNHHLSPMDVAGFVMANGSMSKQTSNEGEIRKALIEADLMHCTVALPGRLVFTTQIKYF